jgi:hypothetical protein
MINGPAKNIFSLLKEDLGIERPTIMVGHDVQAYRKSFSLGSDGCTLAGNDRIR